MDINQNIDVLSVAQMIEQLSKAYISIIRANLPLRTMPSVMLWGAPGVGKSQGVRQIAASIETQTDKKVIITDVRLLLFNPVDLRGIPTANADRTLAVWLKPQIFQMDDSEDVINILFLDEISAAPQSVQAAAYQITLDRTVGEHRLPENCIVIAAGNRVTDRSVAYAMPKALANRLCHMQIESDVDSWHAWAIAHNIHPLVTGFLSYHSASLMIDAPRQEILAFPTPRTWEMVSNILTTVSDDPVEVLPLISGCIGSETALKLCMWNDVFRNIPDIESICLGEDFSVPSRTEGMYALVSQLVSHVRTHRDATTVDNVIRYAYRLPFELRSLLFSDLLQLPNMRPLLEKNESFCAWLEESEDLL